MSNMSRELASEYDHTKNVAVAWPFFLDLPLPSMVKPMMDKEEQGWQPDHLANA